MAVSKIYLTGITPYPISKEDKRLPYVAKKVNEKILKTSLDSEKYIDWEYQKNIKSVISQLKSQGYSIVSVEQSKKSSDLDIFILHKKIAYIFGNETKGINREVLQLSDHIVSIPMLGKKESFNVAQTVAMTLYRSRYLAIIP